MLWDDFSAAAHPRASDERLEVAVLLSAAGGFLDAFTWVGHGGVFANSQTGNVVLLAVFSASGKWALAFRHLPPIAAFAVGVFLANWFRMRASRINRPQHALIGLAIEITVLLGICFLPQGFPDGAIVLMVAFVAALQTASFSKAEGLAYSSVMTTGNLKRGIEAFIIDAVAMPKGQRSFREARVFFWVCTSFGIGAAAGAFTTAKLANFALAVPIGLLAAALAICFRNPPAAGMTGIVPTASKAEPD